MSIIVSGLRYHIKRCQSYVIPSWAAWARRVDRLRCLRASQCWSADITPENDHAYLRHFPRKLRRHPREGRGGANLLISVRAAWPMQGGILLNAVPSLSLENTMSTSRCSLLGCTSPQKRPFTLPQGLLTADQPTSPPEAITLTSAIFRASSAGTPGGRGAQNC